METPGGCIALRHMSLTPFWETICKLSHLPIRSLGEARQPRLRSRGYEATFRIAHPISRNSLTTEFELICVYRVAVQRIRDRVKAKVASSITRSPGGLARGRLGSKRAHFCIPTHLCTDWGSPSPMERRTFFGSAGSTVCSQYAGPRYYNVRKI